MPFDFGALEIDRKVIYKNVEYRVVHQTDSGLLLVVKEDDVIDNKYPITTLVIPDPNE